MVTFGALQSFVCPVLTVVEGGVSIITYIYVIIYLLLIMAELLTLVHPLHWDVRLLYMYIRVVITCLYVVTNMAGLTEVESTQSQMSQQLLKVEYPLLYIGTNILIAMQPLNFWRLVGKFSTVIMGHRHSNPRCCITCCITCSRLAEVIPDRKVTTGSTWWLSLWASDDLVRRSTGFRH